MEKIFKTGLYTLKELEDRKFIVPSYQRPYVWGDLQINKLLFDFYDAFKENDDKYYVGNVLLYEQNRNKETIYQLIDGQQRFTTIWLIAAAIKILGKKSEIVNFLKIGDELRIDFAIREQIKQYMLTLLEKKYTKKNKYSDDEIQNDEYLINISKAVATILGRINTINEIREFGDFIYKKVVFVINTVPQNTDLNKLFTTINNSGIQLEQSDILKSLLLKKMKTEKILFSRIWETCENMNNFFERNVKTLFPDEFKWKENDYDTLKEIPTLKNEDDMADNDIKAYIIDDIIQGRATVGQCNNEIKTQYCTDEKDDEDDTVVYCRSIINFPQLLLHSYRIFLYKKGKEDFNLPFHCNRLLEIFEPLSDESEEIIKEFFKCLWAVRWVFDKKVVKWIQKTDEKDEELFLTSISKQDNSFTREIKEKGKNSMLQSMLYFTGNYNTQIWLTPYLKRLLDNEDSITCLENVDNELSLSKSTDKDTSFELMDKNYRIKESERFDFESYLNESNGTSFKHYWFQKLEYILWKEFRKERKHDRKFTSYRITSKNSVEHVFPRNHEFGNTKISAEKLNDFGNLALLNVSQNSSYSNQAVKKKQLDFFEKESYDSLKLLSIYEGTDLENYDEKKIVEHRKAMIEKIKRHYEK